MALAEYIMGMDGKCVRSKREVVNIQTYLIFISAINIAKRLNVDVRQLEAPLANLDANNNKKTLRNCFQKLGQRKAQLHEHWSSIEGIHSRIDEVRKQGGMFY